MSQSRSGAAGARRRPVLVRRRSVADGDTAEPIELQVNTLLRYARPALLPLASVHAVVTDEPVVGLTFDDGPDPEHTPAVLDALAAGGQRATFFVLVERAERHPDLVARTVAEGHDVQLHGIDHTRLTTLPLREALQRIRDGKRRLEAVTGRAVRQFRPPYGAQSPALAMGARLLGLDVVLWSGWARDWNDDDTAAVTERAIAVLRPGSIILLHDSVGDLGMPGGGTAVLLDRGAVAKGLVEGMARKGYRSRRVSELMAELPAVRTVWTEG